MNWAAATGSWKTPPVLIRPPAASITGLCGWAYPATGDRLSYAAYCRLGVKDLPLYVLDSQMRPSGDSANGPR